MQFHSDKQMYQAAHSLIEERIRMAGQRPGWLGRLEAAERVLSSALGRVMQRLGQALVSTGKRLECYNTPTSVPNP